MNTLLSWIISPIHIFFFVFILLTLHILLVLTKIIFGKKAFERMHHLHNLAHILNIKFTGTKIVKQFQSKKIQAILEDTKVPIIIVSNHQSMYDIPLLVTTFSKRSPKFIAKKELIKFIPSISYSLTKGDHLVIDRSDPKSAIKQLESYAIKASENHWTICIFPEGTRAKDGVLRKFKSSGLEAMTAHMPNGYVLPVVIDGMSQFVKNKFLPVPFRSTITMSVLDPIRIKDLQTKEVTQKTYNLIAQELTKIRTS